MSIGKSSISRAEKAVSRNSDSKNAAVFSVGTPAPTNNTAAEVTAGETVSKSSGASAAKSSRGKTTSAKTKTVTLIPVADIVSTYSESSLACGVMWDELVKSIEKFGIINPLVLRKTDNSYRVISGHKRLFAAKKLGITSVEAKVIETDDETAASIINELAKFAENDTSYGKEKAAIEFSQKKLPDYLL